MNKIFRYELRRLLGNKAFFGILAVSLCYGWMLLTGEIILGVSNTAPFSPWSFGYYLARLLPMICVGELFFLSFFTSGRERRARAITFAAPVDLRKYALVRCGAVLTGTLLLILCAIALCLGFYGCLFGSVGVRELLAPALLTLLPAVVFCLGAGWALGKLHPALAFLFMAVVFLLDWLPLPQAFDFSLSSFFIEYPRTLGALDPAFACPSALLWGRALYAAAGILLLVGSQSKNRVR